MDSQLSSCWKLYYQAKWKLFLLLKQHDMVIDFNVERSASHDQKVASRDRKVCEKMLREMAVRVDDDGDDTELMVDG